MQTVFLVSWGWFPPFSPAREAPSTGSGHRPRHQEMSIVSPKPLQRRFPKKTYGQRWQIETVFSMLRRNLGTRLRAQGHYSQTREIRARILTHNLAILLCRRMFYTERQRPLFRSGRARRTAQVSLLLVLMGTVISM